jgi:hypothetical protein
MAHRSQIRIYFSHRYLMGDHPYTASTFDVMYCQQRRHLQYIMVVKILNTNLTPSPAVLPSYCRRAALTTNSNGTQPAQKGKGGVA